MACIREEIWTFLHAGGMIPDSLLYFSLSHKNNVCIKIMGNN